MEAAGTTEGEGHTRRNADDEVTGENMAVQKGSKPLHRFIRGEPKSLGIAILILGCAELMVGIELLKDESTNSSSFYTPFWQGALFLTSGILSIYTEMYTSKKTVTVCLAMYVVSLLGVLVSFYYRIGSMTMLIGEMSREPMSRHMQVISVEAVQLGFPMPPEAVLLTSSLCVSGLLIFLTTMARLALKSSDSQVVVQHTLPVLTNVTEAGS